MASNALSIAAVAAKIQTVAQVRAAMGAVTLTLSQAYARLPDISSIAGEHDAAQALLDINNKSATILYNIYSDDPAIQDEEISTSHALSAGRIIAGSNDALRAVENAANENLWDLASIVDDALKTVGTTVGNTLQGVTNAVAAGAAGFAFAAWPTILLVAAGAVLYVYRKPVLAAITKAIGP